jgi:hypothetical protein
LFWLLKRFQSIQAGEIGDDQCAFGIFESGDRKTGYTIVLYATKSSKTTIDSDVYTETAIFAGLAEITSQLRLTGFLNMPHKPEWQ